MLGERWVDIFSSSFAELLAGAGPDVVARCWLGAELAAGGAAAAERGDTTAAAAGLMRAWPCGGVLRVRGLPYEACRADIARFFTGGGFELARPQGLYGAPQPSPGAPNVDAVLLLLHPISGRVSGEGFVVFEDEGEAIRARAAMDKKVLVTTATRNLDHPGGGRYVDLFVSNRAEVLRAVATRAAQADANRVLLDPKGAHGARGSGGGSGGEKRQAAQPHQQQHQQQRQQQKPTTCVKLRGLPWSADSNDIAAFIANFCGIPLRHQIVDVCMCTLPNGRASGEA